ncbi:MAG: iron-containing alcohol dehydrogenase [Bacillota bacterium]
MSNDTKARQFVMPEGVFVGVEALQLAEQSIISLGKKALIVMGKVNLSMNTHGPLMALLEKNNIAYVVYAGILSEPTVEMVEEGLAIYKENQCDFLVGVGGGSPMDAMKAIGALVANPGNITEYVGKLIGGAVPPMVAIPTTAGTGSEATQISIISDLKTNVKMILKGRPLVPTVAVVDPKLTVSSPKKLTVATGLDALCHSVESYTSLLAQPMTDTVAMASVKRIFANLEKAFKNGDDLEARMEMSLAALEGGIAINNASVTLIHGMSRPIGAVFHVPHGMSNAMLMGVCLKFAMEGAREQFAELGRGIGVATATDDDSVASENFIIALEELLKAVEVPTLTEYGIDKEKFFEMIPKMANDAMVSGSPQNTRREMTKEIIEELYKKLW